MPDDNEIRAAVERVMQASKRCWSTSDDTHDLHDWDCPEIRTVTAEELTKQYRRGQASVLALLSEDLQNDLRTDLAEAEGEKP